MSRDLRHRAKTLEVEAKRLEDRKEELSRLLHRLKTEPQNIHVEHRMESIELEMANIVKRRRALRELTLTILKDIDEASKRKEPIHDF